MKSAYLHDGTFEGLLTAIFEAFHGRERPDEICSERDYRPSLASAPVLVETDRAKADRVCRGIREKISPSAFEKVTYAYLSEMEGAGMAIYDYLRLLFARTGTAHCPTCGEVISSQTPQQIVDQVLAMPATIPGMALRFSS